MLSEISQTQKDKKKKKSHLNETPGAVRFTEPECRELGPGAGGLFNGIERQFCGRRESKGCLHSTVNVLNATGVHTQTWSGWNVSGCVYLTTMRNFT